MTYDELGYDGCPELQRNLQHALSHYVSANYNEVMQ